MLYRGHTMRKIMIILIALILASVLVTSIPIVNRIKESQIKVYKDKVIIEIEDAQWASFEDTNSMDPIIDEGANAIQIVPKSYNDVHIGDIISYESEYADGIFIHRVVKVGFDPDGWYCIAKGDNNPEPDPGKIRFFQIKKVVIAIIY